MEKISYELRPYFYLMMAAFAIQFANGSGLATFFGGVLLASSFWVLHMRYTYRHNRFTGAARAPLSQAEIAKRMGR